MQPVTIKDAPEPLNTNDKAMWVLGWNECVERSFDYRKAFEQLTALADELCCAIDASSEDVGGHRAVKDILAEFGPATDRAVEAHMKGEQP